jgi:hypothetical protein
MTEELLYPKPKAIIAGETVLCPACGFVGDWDDFDCMGADEDCIFCNACGVELET